MLLHPPINGREYNFIVLNGRNVEGDDVLFFHGEPISFIASETTFPELLVSLGLFQSKGQVRKDIKWGKLNAIPYGFNQFEIGKLKTLLSIYNPGLCAKCKETIYYQNETNL